MNSNDYHSEEDDCDDGGQQLEEYEWHCGEVRRKATALVTHHGALHFASLIADGIVRSVRENATSTCESSANLEAILAGTVAELILTQAVEHHPGALQQPLTRSGFIAIRQGVDAACAVFDAILAVEASR